MINEPDYEIDGVIFEAKTYHGTITPTFISAQLYVMLAAMSNVDIAMRYMVPDPIPFDEFAKAVYTIKDTGTRPAWQKLRDRPRKRGRR